MMNVFLPFIPFYITDIIAEIIGTMIYLSGNWRKKAITDNLRKIGIERKSSKATFINMVSNYFDFIRFYYVKKEWLASITDYSDCKPFINAKDRRIMLVTGHFGNWDVAGLFANMLGMKFISIAELKGVGEENYKIMKRMRERNGLIILALEDPFVALKLEKYVNKGYSPVLLIDRDITDTGFVVNYGNESAKVPKGAFYFAKKFTSHVYAAGFILVKSKKFRYKIVVKEVGYVGNINNGVQSGIDALISLIKDYPDQWFAFDVNWEE